LSLSFAVAATATYNSFFPDSFDNQYYAFKFQDSTQGSAMRYGWVQVSLDNSNYEPPGIGPYLTIFGWAYDDTGDKIPMGAIPEPSSAAIFALGALTVGANGLRSWRRNRAAASDS
jgi:hypothetical protein